MSEERNLPSKKEKTNKNLWKGLFNYSCAIERVFAYAYSKAAARVVMCRRLAKKHDVHPATVLRMFDGSRNNFSIEIEMEVKEVESETDMVKNA